MKILIMANLSSALLIAVYRSGWKDQLGRKSLGLFMVARLIQAGAWLALLLVNIYRIHHFSLHVSITVLYCGLFLETLLLIFISRHAVRSAWIVQVVSFLALLTIFNGSVLVGVPDFIEIAVASYSLFLILVVPGCCLVFDRQPSRLRKLIGLLYLAFFGVAIFRGVEFMVYRRLGPWQLQLLQDITILLLILINLVSGTGFVLCLKEDSDQQIRRLAFFDHLTGLRNRRRFLDESYPLLEQHARFGQDLAVLFIDIDHFKKVNDSLGHGFGDTVLKDFAELIRKSLRAYDLSCRYGGEEFVVLLAQTPLERALMVARRLQTAIGFSSFPAHPEFGYTVSVGVYHFCLTKDALDRELEAQSQVLADGTSFNVGDTMAATLRRLLDEAIEKADAAMYLAKRNGRNRIEVFYDEVPQKEAGDAAAPT